MNDLRPFTHPLLGPPLPGLARYGELQPPSAVIGEIVAGASTIDTKGFSISSPENGQPILDANAGGRSVPARALLASLLALGLGGTPACLFGAVAHSPLAAAILGIVLGGPTFALGWMLFGKRPNRAGANVLVGTRGVQIASLNMHDARITTVADTYDSDNPWFSQREHDRAWLSIRAGGAQAGLEGREGVLRTPHVREAIVLALDKRWAAQETLLQRALAEGRAYVRPIIDQQNTPGEIRVEGNTLSIRFGGHVERSGPYTVTYPAVNVTVPRAGVVVTTERSTISFRTTRGHFELPLDRVGDAAVFAKLFQRGATPSPAAQPARAVESGGGRAGRTRKPSAEAIAHVLANARLWAPPGMALTPDTRVRDISASLYWEQLLIGTSFDEFVSHGFEGTPETLEDVAHAYDLWAAASAAAKG